MSVLKILLSHNLHIILKNKSPYNTYFKIIIIHF